MIFTGWKGTWPINPDRALISYQRPLIMTHLMEPDPFSPAGAVRRAMQSIEQATDRPGWTDMVHRRPPFRARWRRYGPLAVRQTAAGTMPGQQTRKDGQMGHYQGPLA